MSDTHPHEMMTTWNEDGSPRFTLIEDYAIVYLPEDKSAPVWQMIHKCLSREGEIAWLEVWAANQMKDMNCCHWKLLDWHIAEEPGKRDWLKVSKGVHPMSLDEMHELYG
jgi:hypothetical protein